MRKKITLLSLFAFLLAIYSNPVLMQVKASPFNEGDVQDVSQAADEDLDTTKVDTTFDKWVLDGKTASNSDTSTATETETEKDTDTSTDTDTEKDTDTSSDTKTTTETTTSTDTSSDTNSTVQYTVVSGDYLIKIAQNQMGDGSRWREIVELNKDKYPSLLTNPNLIYAGWTFTLPTGSKAQTNTSTSTSTSTGSTTISAKVGEAIDSSGWNSVNPCDPMPSRVSSEFGWRTHPCTGERKFHNGVDLPVPSGTRLNAMANGVVTDCGYDYGGGNYVRIKYDNGYETFYCHLQSSTVSVGQRVECGQQVAYSDNTGQWTTGAHLHMEVKVNGERVNPRDVVTTIKNLN